MMDNLVLGLYRRRAMWARDGVLYPGATALRRGAAISGFVGPNGGGKSYAMVASTIPSLRAGRRVLSTVRLLDGDNPRPCDDQGCYCDKTDPRRHAAAHPCFELWTEWQQLLDAEHCDVLADEVTGVASSREYSSLPAPIANLLVQLRRRDVVLRWTAPNWKRADVIIRECTQMVTVCTGLYPVLHTTEGSLTPDELADSETARIVVDEERAWVENRLLKLISYDSALMDDFEAQRRDDLEVWTRQWIWRPKAEIERWYDTYDQVTTIGSVSETGRCLRCGGTRRPQPCSCDDYVVPGRSGSARKRSEDGPDGTASVIGITQAPARRLLTVERR